MKLQHSLLAAALLAAVSTSAVAQSTGVVTLGGTIVPSSCTISIADGGQFDFGTIDASTLLQTGFTTLATKTLVTTVACTGPAQFAMTVTDNQDASSTTTNPVDYGLGTNPNNSQKIGFYHVFTTTGMVDGAASNMIASANAASWVGVGPTQGWAKNRGTGAGNVYRAFGLASSGPVSATNATFDLQVRPNIRGRSELQLTSDVNLDGSATLEISYL